MREEQFWLLVSLKLSGEATAEDLAALDRLLEQHPEMGARLETLHDWWGHRSPSTPRLKKGAFQRHLRRLNESEHLPSRGPWRRRLYLLTAGVAACITAVLLFIHPRAPGTKIPQPVAQSTVSTKKGSKSKIQLPDGSQVWLNADSRITYNESFRGAAREVQLCGEAYFDVVKDRNHPFIIHTSTIDVLVLGTVLNVRSYSNETNTEAVLIHGSVQVTLRGHPEKKIILQPNDKLVVQNGKGVVVSGAGKAVSREADTSRVMRLGKVHFQERDSVATEVLWVKNKLAFDQESLENVALKIERWFNVKVVITNASLQHTEYSGVFEDESLPQVMEALRLTGNFHYTIHRREVTIRP
ncbi:FecR family protein [Puia dinghuensis]|uniref:Anti-sigma factor n=1 Tax=Puia dinghuensis TaxID=1792502 RepID=A0A8J2XQ75_9BACT|nr:FecR domain-containing protein [Puia dinghuensis]GGA83910.1 anti-sigma factor [Puia dinghuensis]